MSYSVSSDYIHSLFFFYDLHAPLLPAGSANPCSIISPGSMLLSASGSIAFKTCSRSEDVASFTSPEMVLARTSSSRQDVEKMVVFSLGMTLYWTADYQLPQNQPVQLSNHLNSLLLKMCEEAALRRPDLLAVLEESEQHHKNALLPPPDTVIRQLVQDVLQDPVSHNLKLFSYFQEILVLTLVWFHFSSNDTKKIFFLTQTHWHWLIFCKKHISKHIFDIQYV
uniref:KIND domain-containing protein n=1 Tax=Astyanax mexicanus TaxID=7994 RepID=A0A8B9HLG6_ASTMX